MSIQNLARIAAVGGVFVLLFECGSRTHMSYRITQTEAYKDALRMLHNHSEAVNLLGTPIKDQRVKLNDTKANGCDGDIRWFTVPVTGSRGYGRLYFEVDSSEHVSQMTNVQRIALLVDSAPKKTVVIRNMAETDAYYID